jgi:hypothetical protein
MISPDKPITAYLENGESGEGQIILFKSNVTHCCSVQQNSLSLFIDPESASGHLLSSYFD